MNKCKNVKWRNYFKDAFSDISMNNYSTVSTSTINSSFGVSTSGGEVNTLKKSITTQHNFWHAESNIY